jgi:hypothetical protein
MRTGKNGGHDQPDLGTINIGCMGAIAFVSRRHRGAIGFLSRRHRDAVWFHEWQLGEGKGGIVEESPESGYGMYLERKTAAFWVVRSINAETLTRRWAGLNNVKNDTVEKLPLNRALWLLNERWRDENGVNDMDDTI